MNNAIIGTAGHVDHGKTLLIKALTGMDTDRLAEEKKRGIKIELGFAYMDLPNGEKAGIVDVPGHEKFIRNMLAGAGSIDLAILVVAADEGIMPQTREHLAILGLLGISRGLVALNKTDLVDRDWLEMVMLDIEEELAHSFLAQAPILPVSAHTGEGVEELRQEIFRMLAQSPAKRLAVPFRLPIDRVFTMDGFGTVVTGTLIEGSLNLGQDVVVFPSGLATKARRIQVHGKQTERAVAGQRVAVNLAGLKISDLSKGDLVAAPNSIKNTRILDVVVEINEDCAREIRHNSRLHLHHGTRDILCTMVLLEGDKLTAGQRAYGQLRLAQPLAAKPNDRFVLRFYSPAETIGGGMILDPLARKVRRRDAAAAGRLAIKEKGGLSEKIEVICIEAGNAFDFVDREYIRKHYFFDEDGFDSALNQLLATGQLVDLNGFLLHISFLEAMGKRAQGILDKYHRENPLQNGMAVREFCSRLLPGGGQVFEHVVEPLATLGFVEKHGQEVARAGFVPTASDAHKKIQARLIAVYTEAGFATPDHNDVAAEFVKERKAFAQTFEALVKTGALVALTPQIHLSKENYDRAVDIFAGLAEGGKEVTLADFRDAIGASRKYALAILEYFDKRGLTKKVGDGRVLKQG